MWRRPARQPHSRRSRCSGTDGTRGQASRSRTYDRRTQDTVEHCRDSHGCGQLRIVEALDFVLVCNSTFVRVGEEFASPLRSRGLRLAVGRPAVTPRGPGSGLTALGLQPLTCEARAEGRSRGRGASAGFKITQPKSRPRRTTAVALVTIPKTEPAFLVDIHKRIALLRSAKARPEGRQMR